jgi:dihydroorotate dehydrogenase (fumarate)
MEESGIGAVVLPSLFEEELELENQAAQEDLARGTESFPEALSYFPKQHRYNLGPDAYLELLRKAREGVSIPVMGSLNGISPGGWTKYAKLMEQAGASAIELNLYDVPTDSHTSGAHVEQTYCHLVRQVRESVKIPIAVKLSPFFSAIANAALRIDEAGADGLVLFNRFYQPDFDIETLEIVPSLKLSEPNELLLRLHWTAILYGKICGYLAITGGVHSAQDVLKSMMAGAHVAMMTSALLRHGISHAALVLEEMKRWMEEHEYESIRQMRGSLSQRSIANPATFERANYMKVLSSYTLERKETIH